MVLLIGIQVGGMMIGIQVGRMVIGRMLLTEQAGGEQDISWRGRAGLNRDIELQLAIDVFVIGGLDPFVRQIIAIIIDRVADFLLSRMNIGHVVVAIQRVYGKSY